MKHTKENKMNRIDAIKLLTELKELKQDRTYNKFLIYAITKSVTSLSEILEEAQAKEKGCYTEEYETFTNSRLSLLRVYSAKDEQGNPIVEEGQVSIDESKRGEFEEEIKKLVDANRETLELVENNLKTFEEWSKEEVDVKLTKVSFKYIPDELLPSEYNTLSHLIKESEDEIEL